MAVLPTTQLETHPAGTPNPNPIIDGNWSRLEAIFAALSAEQPGHAIEWDATNRKFVLRPGPQTLTDAASIAWDWSAGIIASVTLGANRTLANPTNGRPGTAILRVIQDATGGRELSLDTAYRTPGGSGVTLSTAAGAIDVLTFVNFGDGVYYLVPSLDFS